MRALTSTLFALACLAIVTTQLSAERPSAINPAPPQSIDRSPTDLAVTPDDLWLVTANQTANTVSLIDIKAGKIAAEVACGQHPSCVAISPDGRQAYVTCSESGELAMFNLTGGKLSPAGNIPLGFDPRGVALSPDGKLAYVALAASNEVAVVNLGDKSIATKIAVGRWPRFVTLSPDGKRLAVGTSGDGSISVVDTAAREMLFQSKFVGLNIGQLAPTNDGQYVYFPWMQYGDRPISVGNIQQGWVLGNKVARVRLDERARREALSLDPRGKAVADPHGLVLAPDESWLAIAAAGSHELVVLKTKGLTVREDGPGDHMPPALVLDDDRFWRIPLGGRPLGMRAARDGRRVFVANYLSNSVQVVDVIKREVEQTISLGGPAEVSLVRRGEAIFHDGQRSADQWYSCASCHYEGATNLVTMDTRNDGSNGTFKMVLSLRNVTRTGPYFWHGWQKDLSAAVQRSMVESMGGPKPTSEDVDAVLAYLETLSPPKSPFRQADGSLTVAAQRGQQIFESQTAACANCHKGPTFTDGEIHDVGLGSEFDVYKGYNTPSLLGVFNKPGYLHHGRAKTLEDLLTDLHSPEKVSGTRALTPAELADLVEYLRAL